jgi:Zn-dependent peptidase ImmA (M78 family)
MPPTITSPSEWIRAYQTHPPINVHRMADDLGIRISELPALPVGTSGKLFRDSRSRAGWSIAVNQADSPTRKRFTIAHEIAHYLLHRNDIRDGVVDDVLYRSQHLSGSQETEANRFAADILMPYDLLQSYARIYDVDNLAKKFEVSAQAMSIRLGIPLP